ncbi:MAG TPA: hypothetical protein PKJ99_10770 [Thermoanaerobaculales bacterium]|nr:hypothetical protein [Thermoanaerobaculales bacterium]HQL30807.1 hypothetical protein [Thermoanaerobaculales bacterium]
MWRTAIVAVALACLLAPVATAAGEREDQAFEQLKSLAGAWDAATPDGPATIIYRVASAGSIVIEEMFPGTAHEMITVYHRDGDKLVATHYCAIGNQPRTALDATAPLTDGMHFAFAGGTNMKPDDGHIHEWTIRVVDADHVEERWTYWEGGKEEHATSFTMTRRSAK